MKYYLHIKRNHNSEGIREGVGSEKEIREQFESLFDKKQSTSLSAVNCEINNDKKSKMSI